MVSWPEFGSCIITDNNEKANINKKKLVETAEAKEISCLKVKNMAFELGQLNHGFHQLTNQACSNLNEMVL